jgi:signal-transduction protein with cAMP-binding, CBS, and nucleotidyltransferase domain
MVVLDIVKTKAEPLPVIRQSESVLAAVRKMLELKESGLLIMTPGGDPVGIITEKDVMHLVAERYTQLDKVEVWEVMSKQLLTVPHTTLLDEALKLMTDKHIHHLPVMQDKKPVGLITLDDIIAAQLRRTEAEARALKDFIALQ